MSARLPLDSLSLSYTNLPLCPALSSPGTGGFDLPPHTYDAKSAAEVMRQMMGEVSEKIAPSPAQCDEAEETQNSAPMNKPPGVSLRPALSLHRTETLFSSSDDDDDDRESHTLSPVTSLSSDDAFDYDRAMSFAKCRAASFGMGAAMRNLNATLEADDPSAEERLSSVASKVIASISRSPPAMERQFSHSSVLSDVSEDDDNLTEAERQEHNMVTEYIKRWASNVRLDSTYWQGFNPLHLNVAVPLAQELTVYLAEQIIRDVSAQLNLPAPLEYERSRPRLSSDPTHFGSAGLVDYGYLIRRAMPSGYVPQQVLERSRAAFNEECKANERRPVQTVTVRLQSGAKRAAGTRKEATTRRDPWTRTASKLRVDVTLWMVAGDE